MVSRFAYRLPSAIFVCYVPIGLHEVVAPTFPQSSLELCYTVARQVYRHLQLYIFIIQHIDTLPKYGQKTVDVRRST